MPLNRVLITGTTSGLGLSALRIYYAQGKEIVAVNRRRVPELETLYPKVDFRVLDIANGGEVLDLVRELVLSRRAPDIFLLNAGINLADNYDGLDYASFQRVVETNLLGVMSFVGAIRDLKLSNRKVVALSSTSNIVANPTHVAYAVTKKALQESFRMLATRNPENLYQTIVLGPVATEIMKGYPAPSGLQAKLLSWLQVSSERAAARCLRFIETDRKTLYYPLSSCAFYLLVRPLLKLFPSLYGGTRSPELRTVRA